MRGYYRDMRGAVWIACVTAASALASCSSDTGGNAESGGNAGTAGSAGSDGNSGTGGLTSEGGAAGRGSGGASGGAAGSGSDASTDAAKPEPGKLLGSFQLTYYWVTTEAEFSRPKDTDLFDAKCNLLASTWIGSLR